METPAATASQASLKATVQKGKAQIISAPEAQTARPDFPRPCDEGLIALPRSPGRGAVLGLEEQQLAERVDGLEGAHKAQAISASAALRSAALEETRQPGWP